MVKQFWINLPVKDIAKSKIFFSGLGFTLNNAHGNPNDSACLLIGESPAVVMLFTEPQMEHFMGQKISDTNSGSELLLSIDAESREEVEAMAEKARKSGGKVFSEPAEIQGWMYGCGFADLDGHRWNVLYGYGKNAKTLIVDAALKTSLWQQFGASIDMLENAIVACPEKDWDTPDFFWYNAYHCIFYLDYYVSDPQHFVPPAPYTLSEFDPEGILPERIYSKKELCGYLDYGRQKCKTLIMNLTAEGAAETFSNEYRTYSIFEILLYNMRHVQHHAAQLNLLLRQNGSEPPRWVSQAGL